MSATAHKWIPAIETDICMGCGLCVKACPPACLEMVWDFATLVRAEDCTSCAECGRVCPHGVIQMDWASATGSPLIGRWAEEPPAPAVLAKRSWWQSLTGSQA